MLASSCFCLKKKVPHSIYVLPKSPEKAILGSANFNEKQNILSWKTIMLSCLNYSLHFDLFLPQSLHYKARNICVVFFIYVYLVSEISYSCQHIVNCI